MHPGASGQDLYGMRQDGKDDRKHLFHPGRVAGEIDDERLSPRTNDATAEDCVDIVTNGFHAHVLRHAGHLAVDDVKGRFRGDVPRPKPSAPCGKDKINI